MLKLTKRRFSNKRNRNISSIRRKRMASRRKRQVGGEFIILPKKITFRIYPQPDKDFTDSNDCAKKSSDCTSQKENCEANCDSLNKTCENELESCRYLALICPAKWHEIIDSRDVKYKISPKIPIRFEVEATRDVPVDVSETANLFEVLRNYRFKVKYNEIIDTKIHSVNDILDRSGRNHHIVKKSQTETISLDELRTIMNYYFFNSLNKEFVQYIGEINKEQNIAWTDNRSTSSEGECSSMGQHADKKTPTCNDEAEYTLVNSLKLGNVCSAKS